MKLWHDKRTWVSKKAQKKLERLTQPDIKSIAVIKHAGYGDLLCTRPFLVTLRQAFPQAKVTFSAISHYLRGVPEDLVDRVHVVSGGGDGKGWFARYREYRKLGRHNFLFDLTASTPSFLITAVNPADFKVGFQHSGVHRLVYDVAIQRAEYRFEAETFLEQLHILGLAFEWPPPYAYPVEPLVRQRPYCVYFPTASVPGKAWPASHFVELIDQVARAYTTYDHIVLSGLASWEMEVSKAITAKLSKHRNILLDSAHSDIDTLIKGSTLLVSSDTGIRHLGIAVGTPTVGIFINTMPFGYWPHFGRHEVIYDPNGGIPNVTRVKQAVEKILHPQ